MKFVDDSQNLRVRLRLIQALVLVLLGVLCVRLYLPANRERLALC